MVVVVVMMKVLVYHHLEVIFEPHVLLFLLFFLWPMENFTLVWHNHHLPFLHLPVLTLQYSSSRFLPGGFGLHFRPLNHHKSSRPPVIFSSSSVRRHCGRGSGVVVVDSAWRVEIFRVVRKRCRCRLHIVNLHWEKLEMGDQFWGLTRLRDLWLRWS